MKRSRVVQLSLVTSVATVLTGCSTKPDRYCVDDKQNVIDPSNCQDPQRSNVGHYYHWYYGGARGFVPYGTHLSGGSYNSPGGGFASSPSATTRGVFGHAGEAASAHASGHGGGGGE